MSNKRDLLKEAIADAKAIKEMAIANAKAALEESFTPQLQSMLSAKLQEMEMEDEEEIDLDEILNEIEEEEEMYESEITENEEEDMESEEESVEIEDMTDEDLKAFIEDVIKDMASAGEIPGLEAEESEEETEEEEMEDEVDLAELLAEIEAEETDEDEISFELDENEDLEEIFGFGKKGSGGTQFVKDFIKQNETEVEKVFNMEGDSKTKLKAATPLIMKFMNQNRSKMDASAMRSDVSVLRTAMGIDGLGGGEKGTVQLESEEVAELYEKLNTLQKELNEVNLLNAKLLYSNKIFKSKNLTESQKIKVLSSFDKATTPKEAKLVYNTLEESLKSVSTPIKENLGSASRVMGTTKVKQPILEANEQFNRMQKLAGLL